MTHDNLCFHFFHFLLAQIMCEMNFRMKGVTSFIHKTVIIVFEIHTPIATLQCFLSQYVTWTCCSDFQGNILKAQPYSLKHTTIGRTLWTIEQPNSKISALPLTTLTIDGYLCFWRESNPQSHQARGLNPTS